MNKENIISALVIVLAVTAVGYYISNDIRRSSVVSENTAEKVSSEINIEGDGGYKIELISSEPIPSLVKSPIPDLDRQIMFGEGFSDEKKAIIIKDIKKLSEELKENSDLFNNWIALGLQRKEIDDYEGARQAWEYASMIRPADSVSLANLGNLYHYYLKDYAKSEENLLKAIENNTGSSGNIAFYRSLHELYKYSYEEKAGLADDILFEGLEVNPNNLDLLILLGLYYKEKGDIDNSRKYYEKALAEARKQGNNDLADALQKDIFSL